MNWLDVLTARLQSLPPIEPETWWVSVIIGLLGVLFLIATGTERRRRKRKKRTKKRWRIDASHRVLKTLATKQSFPEKMGYLRDVNAYTFEEAILSAFAGMGYPIKRNARYSGDGGIDGQVWINDQHYFIQAKRYSDHIRKADIRELDQLCQVHGTKGLFIHTGKTGGGLASAHTDNVQIVSGKRMLALLEQEGIQHALPHL